MNKADSQRLSPPIRQWNEDGGGGRLPIGQVCMVVLAAAPFFMLLFKLSQFGFGFPYWDEMLLAPLIAKAHSGSLTLLDLWSQQNEHRLLFPRLIMIAIGLLLHWNIAWVLACSVLCALGTVMLLFTMVLSRKDDSSGAQGWWTLPFFAFFVFSWTQMENWVWGLELMFFLCNFAAVGGILLLDRRPGSWGALFGAIGLGIVAAYSFANGLLFWFAAFPMVFARNENSGTQRVLRAVVWILAGTLVIESYLIGYHKPGVSPSLSLVLQQPLAYVGYVILYLGSPVSAVFSTPPWHGGQPHSADAWQFIPGTLGVLCMALLLWRARRKNAMFQSMLPWCCIAAFAIGSALITAWGRTGFGLGQALSSRYITTGMLFWCALVGMAAMDFAQNPASWAVSPRRRRLLTVVMAAVLSCLISLTFSVNRSWEDIAHWKKMGWKAIAAGHEARLYLLDLWGDENDFVGPDRIRNEYLPILLQYRLCGYRAYGAKNDAYAPEFLREARQFMDKSMWVPALTYLETARFLDPNNRELAELTQKVPEAAWERYAQYNAGMKPPAQASSPVQK